MLKSSKTVNKHISRIALVVQARVGSSRFPGKALAKLAGKPSLEWVFLRLSGLELAPKILATSDRPVDTPLIEMAHRYGFEVVRGSEKDVLSRFAAVARFWGPDIIIRITGDCPLIDPRLVEWTLKEYLKEPVDYAQLAGVIDGFDVGIMLAGSLLEADLKALLPSEREHVTPYLRRFKKYRKILFPGEDLSHYHLSLDYREDLELLENILRYFLPRTDFTYEEVVALIKGNPSLREAALRHAPNEGYLKSLEEDRIFIKGLKAPPLRLSRTQKWFEEVKERIPLASQTYSKSYYMFSRGVAPLFVKEARGCTLVDPDGNHYTDYTMALGACLLGYAFEPVVRAAEEALRKGSVFTLPHLLEGEVAEKLCTLIPGAEMVRFGKNGSDVTAAAVRLARAYTGRDLVICCGYHGWQDWYIGITTKNAGVPEPVKRLTRCFPYNDLKTLERIFEREQGQVACVIMEPVILDPPEKDFLQGVRYLCDRYGALLIFDEVITGFRFGLGGAQERYGIRADLVCLGKSLGNGLPISALLGPREIMKLLEHEVFFSFTFGGEIVSLAAAEASLQAFEQFAVPEHVCRVGEILFQGLREIISRWQLEDVFVIRGFPERFVLEVKGKEAPFLKALLQQETARRGELFTGSFLPSLAHQEATVKRSLEIYEEVIRLLRYAREYDLLKTFLEGEPLGREIFRLRS